MQQNSTSTSKFFKQFFFDVSSNSLADSINRVKFLPLINEWESNPMSAALDLSKLIFILFFSSPISIIPFVIPTPCVEEINEDAGAQWEKFFLLFMNYCNM